MGSYRLIVKTAATGAVLLGLALLLWWLGGSVEQAQAAPQEPPKIPHTLDGRQACLTCHGVPAFKVLPASHEGRPDGTCLLCHKPGEVLPIMPIVPKETVAAERTATPVPPSVETMPSPPTTPSKPAGPIPPDMVHVPKANFDCVLCHGLEGPKPFPEFHAGFKDENCATCHKSVWFTPVAENVSAPPPEGPRIGGMDIAHFIERLFFYLTTAVVAFGIIHVEGDFLRWLMNKLKGK